MRGHVAGDVRHHALAALPGGDPAGLEPGVAEQLVRRAAGPGRADGPAERHFPGRAAVVYGDHGDQRVPGLRRRAADHAGRAADRQTAGQADRVEAQVPAVRVGRVERRVTRWPALLVCGPGLATVIVLAVTAA